MKPIIKCGVLFPVDKLGPEQNEITLSGMPYLRHSLGCERLLFKTSPVAILEAIWVKFINEKGSKQLKRQFQELYKKICAMSFCRSIALVDDMTICGTNKAFIDAVNALAAVGFEYGFLFPRELEYGYRVDHSPEVLKLQKLLDKELDRWSTVETLSTDPGQIASWELFHSVLYSLSDMLGD